jgi:hypothetical protein
MAETANLEQTLLETVRSLLPAQQEAVLDFARSISPTQPHPRRDRAEQAQKMLLDLEKIQAHPDKPTAAVYVDSLLRTIREIRDRYPHDPYTEVIMALHDAMAVRNQWVTYKAEQYRGALEILSSLSSQEEISNEKAEDAILSLDALGFETLPLSILSTLDEFDETDHEEQLS